jgi:hypothetical protein
LHISKLLGKVDPLLSMHVVLWRRSGVDRSR